MATVPFGGADQVWFDPPRNRYIAAGSRWHNSGVNDNGGGCSAANVCNPALGIIDARSRTVLAKLPIGNNAHSVAVDPLTGLAFLPYSSAAAPAGAVINQGFAGTANGGISVISIK